MSTISLSEINQAVEAAYATAADSSAVVHSGPTAIGDHATIQTDIYNGPHGSGWAVTAMITLGVRIVAICKQQGPETWRNTSVLTVGGINAAQKALRAKAYVSRGCSDLDYVDAVTKQSSDDATLKAVGDAQLAVVLAARLKIKTDYPYIS